MSKTKLFIGQWDVWAVTDDAVRVCPKYRFILGYYEWRDAYRTVSSLEADEGVKTLEVNSFTEKSDPKLSL